MHQNLVKGGVMATIAIIIIAYGVRQWLNRSKRPGAYEGTLGAGLGIGIIGISYMLPDRFQGYSVQIPLLGLGIVLAYWLFHLGKRAKHNASN